MTAAVKVSASHAGRIKPTHSFLHVIVASVAVLALSSARTDMVVMALDDSIKRISSPDMVHFSHGSIHHPFPSNGIVLSSSYTRSLVHGGRHWSARSLQLPRSLHKLAHNNLDEHPGPPLSSSTIVVEHLLWRQRAHRLRTNKIQIVSLCALTRKCSHLFLRSEATPVEGITNPLSIMYDRPHINPSMSTLAVQPPSQALGKNGAQLLSCLINRSVDVMV